MRNPSPRADDLRHAIRTPPGSLSRPQVLLGQQTMAGNPQQLVPRTLESLQAQCKGDHDKGQDDLEREASGLD
jgi:hypothetical protein